MTDHPLHILEWLAEMGDDVALAEHPVDRFAESKAAMAEVAERTKSGLVAGNGMPLPSKGTLQDRVAAIRKVDMAKPSTRNDAVLPDETVVAQARELAEAAVSIEALKLAIDGFEGCNLRMNAKQTVFANGNPQSEIMLIDEHPGRDEDVQGIPFAGRSGALLEKMLAAIGLKQQQVYSVAALPWHSPGNRPPTPAEVEICKPFLQRHISLSEPKILIIMGNTGARMLIDPNAQLLSVRGKWTEVAISGKSYSCLATLNPGFLLKQPAQKRLAWQDLLLIKAKLLESSTLAAR